MRDGTALFLLHFFFGELFALVFFLSFSFLEGSVGIGMGELSTYGKRGGLID
jgi:hypothetical protein